MEILIITTEIGNDGGGLSFSCSRIAEILSLEHHNVKTIISSEYPIEVAQNNSRKDLYDAIRKECKLKIETELYKNTDIVIGFGGRYNGYYTALLAERIGANFILCLRGSDINIVKWNVEDCWYTFEACRKASKIACLSEEMRNNVIGLCPSAKEKTIIIPNEQRGKFKNIDFPNLPNNIIIGTAASYLNEKKGIANLFHMVAAFKKAYSIPITFVLVGGIDANLKDEYLHIAEKIGISENIVYKGYMPRSEFHEEIYKWDFYIQGSICEGYSNSVAESLQNGVAFIVSPTGCIAEILKSSFPELLFDSWKPEKMAEKLFKLVNINNKNILYRNAFEEIERVCEKSSIINQWKSLLLNRPTMKYAMDIEHVIVVGLHDVQGELHDSITTPTAVFKQFVDFVYSKGLGLCSMKDYLDMDKEDRKSWIVCTFDDGYKNIVDIVLPILSSYKFSATVFLCTGLIGKDNIWNNKDATLRKHLDEKDIDKLIEGGWEIASHGVKHRNLLKLSDLDIEIELNKSKEYLERRIGYAISYAYPYGSFNKFTQKLVKKYYRYAFSVSLGGTSLVADAFQLKRYSISDIYQLLSEAIDKR